MPRKKKDPSAGPAPIVGPGKTVPKQWEGMERDEAGKLKRKSLGFTPKGASTLLKKRFGRMAFRALKQELKQKDLQAIVREMVKVATTYPDHKDWGRICEFLMRLGTDPDKRNDDAATNVNITINAIRENAVAARAFAGLRPINVKVIQSTSSDVGGRDLGAGEQQLLRLPTPAAPGPA